MGDLKGIHEKDFEKLSKYLGEAKAMEYIKKEKYNYQAVSTKLLLFDIKEYSKRKPIVFWSCITILIALFVYYVIDTIYY